MAGDGSACRPGGPRVARLRRTALGHRCQDKSLIMIIFANVLLEKAIISNESFSALPLIAAATTMPTAPIFSLTWVKLKMR